MSKDTRAPFRRRSARLLTLFVTLSLLLSGLFANGIPQNAYAATAVPAPKTLRLNFVGDILLGSTVGKLIEAEGPSAPWLGVKDLLSSADLTIGNLECAVGTTGSPVPGKEYTFRADPISLQGLVDSGFDAVSLANNHALDFGAECFLEGLGLIEAAGIDAIGGGADEAEARKPFIFRDEETGISVGILATNAHYPSDTWSATPNRPGMATDAYGWFPKIVASIEELSQTVDIVVVVIHWGQERSTAPIAKAAAMEKAMKTAGADAIIGSHPHVMNGFYYDGNAITAHSLGNFVFTTRPDIPACQVGAILSLTVSKDKVESAEVMPTKIVWGKTVLMEGAERSNALSTLSSLSRPLGTDIDPEGSIVPLLYTDMNDHWARFTVGRLAARGSVEGYPDLTYRPESQITKDEFAAMFVRATTPSSAIDSAVEPEGFALCAKDHWSHPYLAYLASTGVVSPADPNWTAGKACTRMDAALAMWKRAGSPAAASNPTPGPAATAEISGLDPASASAVTWAMEKGIFQGYPDGSLGLARTITRAEMAEVLWRYLVMSTT